MARAALTKLFLLVILAFIICLPEFFTLYRVTKVNFFCRPYRPCERVNQVKKGENARAGNAEAKGGHMCDPYQTPDQEKWEQACAQEDESNTTDSASDLRGGRDDLKMSWFVCKTDMEMAELHRNISTSAPELHLEVSAALQLPDAETLNLTLYGRSNYSCLHLYPPEEEEEEEEEGDDEGQGKVFYCCLPLLPTSKSANQSRCLLWFANQTVWNSTAKEKLPWKRTQKDEWQCVLRVVWLALLCLVFLSIVTSMIGQIYREKRVRRNTKVNPVSYNFTAQQLNDGGKQSEVRTPEETNLHAYGFHSWPGLSPIKEVDSENESDKLMDGSADHCHTANLHHRSHPCISSIKE